MTKAAVVVRSTPLRPQRAWDGDGAELSLAVFEERAGWLLSLTGETLNATLASWWTPEHFRELGGGQDRGGKHLPSSGFVLASRLGWNAVVPEKVAVPSRFLRGVLVCGVALMRAREEQAGLLPAMLPLVDAAGVYDPAGVRATPAGQWATHRQMDGLARSITRFRNDHGRDPAHLTEAFAVPQVRSPVFPLSACDRQFVAMERHPDHLLLRLKLPVCPRPERVKDWQWHTCVLPIPPQRQALETWSLPDIRIKAGKLLFSSASVTQGAAWQSVEAALGVDWSPSALVVSATVRQGNTGLTTNGESCGFDEAGRVSKLLRLQREEEHTRRKLRRIERLLAGRPDPVLEGRVEVLGAQLDALSRKRVRLGLDLAWLAANHLVNRALRSGAALIAFEDLRDFDAQGRGRWQNNRSSQSVRGKVYACVEQLAARHGIEVCQVPARGTSSNCPECDGKIERPAGHFSALCPACGLAGDRDVLAAVNIAARALRGYAGMRRPKGRPKRVPGTPHQAVVISAGQARPAKAKGIQPTRCRTLPARLPRPPKGGWTKAQRREHQQSTSFPARASTWGMVERTPLRVVSSHGESGLPVPVAPGVTQGQEVSDSS